QRARGRRRPGAVGGEPAPQAPARHRPHARARRCQATPVPSRPPAPGRGSSRARRAVGRSPRRPQDPRRDRKAPATTRSVGVKLVDRRVFIDAVPDEVYQLLTDARLLAEWMAPIAHTEPRTGGTTTWTHANGDTVP